MATEITTSRPVRQRQPRPRPVLTAGWTDPPTDACPTGTAMIALDGRADFYDVTEVECQIPDARGFRVVKRVCEADGDYHVLLSMANAQDCSCECKGFLHHGHCKHVSALPILLAGLPAETEGTVTPDFDPFDVELDDATDDAWIRPLFRLPDELPPAA